MPRTYSLPPQMFLGVQAGTRDEPLRRSAEEATTPNTNFFLQLKLVTPLLTNGGKHRLM